MIPEAPIGLSGQRFKVSYLIQADERAALATAQDICVEQTIELPIELLPVGEIRAGIVGQIEGFEVLDRSRARATISYAVESAGGELTQLLNVVVGNYSLKPGVRVEKIEVPEALADAFPGPRFGRQGLRARIGAHGRPLLCSALKPVGLPATALADLAYQMARGGIDLIKDDHGLANQPFAPFEERVKRCSDAVARANRETGEHSSYVPNVTASGDEVARRARQAKAAGAGGLLIAPGLAGLGVMERLARDDEIALPILSHPAFQGSYIVAPDHGASPYFLFGQLARLAGADASIFPSFGGRFSLTREDCRVIVAGTTASMGAIKPIFPVPAGGMTLDRVPELLGFYGTDVILLIGGGLFQLGPGLADNCRAFRRSVELAPDPSASLHPPSA
ncbi:MAG: RuBisCO large subunit C-terminal-like domain-containing protein [Chloroflexota bacterium]